MPAIFNPNNLRLPFDTSNKSCVVAKTNATQPWIVDANGTWSGNRIPRQNHGFARWPTLTRNWIQFRAIATSNAFGSHVVTIAQNGLKFADVVLNGDAKVHTYTVSGLTIGSTVDVYEMWDGINGAQNTGADSPNEAGVLTDAYLPAGQTIQKLLCSIGYLIIASDSVFGAAGVTANQNTLSHWGSVSNRLRLLAHAKGRLLTTLEYGGACIAGDGLTAANFATWANQAWINMGSPSVMYVIINPFHNDYATGAGGVGTTPAQGFTFLQALVTALPSAWTKVIVDPLPALSEVAVNTFTLGNWRTTATRPVTGTNVIHLDSTTWGLNTTTNYTDGVHLIQSGLSNSGVDIVIPFLQPSLDLS